MAIVTLNLSALADTRTPLRGGALAAARVATLHDAILVVVGRDELPPQRRRLFDATILPALHSREPRLAVDGDGAWIQHVSARVWHVEPEPLSERSRVDLPLEAPRYHESDNKPAKENGDRGVVVIDI